MSDTHKHVPGIGQNVTNGQLYDLLVLVKDDVEQTKRLHETLITAFVVNDLDKPDLDGHRRHHIQLNRAQENMEGYKYEATKRILTAILGGLLTLIGGVLYQRFMGG